MGIMSKLKRRHSNKKVQKRYQDIIDPRHSPEYFKALYDFQDTIVSTVMAQVAKVFYIDTEKLHPVTSTDKCFIDDNFYEEVRQDVYKSFHRINTTNTKVEQMSYFGDFITTAVLTTCSHLNLNMNDVAIADKAFKIADDVCNTAMRIWVEEETKLDAENQNKNK